MDLPNVLGRALGGRRAKIHPKVDESRRRSFDGFVSPADRRASISGRVAPSSPLATSGSGGARRLSALSRAELDERAEFDRQVADLSELSNLSELGLSEEEGAALIALKACAGAVNTGCAGAHHDSARVATVTGTDPPSAAWAWFAHEGGAGGLGKEQQDAWLALKVSEGAHLYAVLDGHGKQYGRLAALAARDALRAFVVARAHELSREPEAMLRAAFLHMHEAVRTAMREANPRIVVHPGRRAYRGPPGAPSPPDEPFVGGPFLLSWTEVEEAEEGEPNHEWDAVDGGTTITVAVVLAGRRIVLAVAGDSSAVLLAQGTRAGGDGGGGGGCRAELLVEEHGPTNSSEHARMLAYARDHGTEAGLRFVYDCPGGAHFDIFKSVPADGPDGAPAFDEQAARDADAHECNVKNARGDLFTIITVPEEEVTLPPLPATTAGADARTAVVREQAITVTRSLGDFYAHHHGVSCEPELRSLELVALKARGLLAPRLVLASDGLWDLWTFAEVARQLNAGGGLGECTSALGEATRARGAEYFGEAADNLTGVVIDLQHYLGEIREGEAGWA